MPAFQCRYPGCNASYARKEHLNRHTARHNQQERFSCPHCDSALTRGDLLRRHVRKYHPEKELKAPRALKACRACHSRKERCDGGDPCNRCLQRKIVCSRTGRSRLETGQEANDEHRDEPPLAADLVGSVPGASRWIAQDYIDIYFLYFHHAWPFLHRGSFDISKEPCILLQSMMMIGLWIKGEDETRKKAMTFHRKLLSQIQSQRVRLILNAQAQMQYMLTSQLQWDISDDSSTPWPMASFQGILLQLIFAVMIKKDVTFDLSLRCQLPASEYELLTSLVRTCRRLGMFYYPTMLAQHNSSAPIILVWLSVEEIKRFGLALYKLCRLCTHNPDDRPAGGGGDGVHNELLTLADLEFCMPDCDDLWNALSTEEMDAILKTSVRETSADRDPDNWISNASGKLRDTGVCFDWI